MCSNRYYSQVGFLSKSKVDYCNQMIDEILAKLENRHYRSIREIASAFGKNRQLGFA
jgi:hypothetical protein